MENGEDPRLDLTPSAPPEDAAPPRSRRSFLGTLAAAAAAFVAAVLGFTPKAEAVPVACCNLCLSPTSGCVSVNGTWAWSCCLQQNASRYSCVEYYKKEPDWGAYERTGSCSHIYQCSWYYRIGSC